jgi:SAM-dependent methyltransferase
MTWTDTVMARFAAGEISREIALAQLLLSGEVPDTAALPPAIADLARAQQARLPALAALAKRGFDGATPADTAALFDRLAIEAPEAGVAFYSFGDPTLLATATAELVDVIRDWARIDGRDVLDFGCGIGRVAIALAPFARQVVGVDVSAGMVDQARHRAAALPNLSFAHGDGEVIPLADRVVDVIVAADCFPFLVQAGEAAVERQFAEFARVLRSGGELIVCNWSYRGDDARDIADAHAVGGRHGFGVIEAGARPFAIWDGRGFLFRRA